jgi:hypothetical protein
VVDHPHAEAVRAAPRNALADAAHAQDAQRAAVHLGAGKHVVATTSVPLAGAQEMFALGHAPRGGHQQRKAEVGRGLGQHVGRVGGQHAGRVMAGTSKLLKPTAMLATMRSCGQAASSSASMRSLPVVSTPGLALQPGTSSSGDQTRRPLVSTSKCCAQALHHLGEDGARHQDGGALAHGAGSDRQQVDFEQQRGVGRNHAARTARAVAQRGRDDQAARAADGHALHAFVPALDDVAGAQREIRNGWPRSLLESNLAPCTPSLNSQPV